MSAAGNLAGMATGVSVVNSSAAVSDLPPAASVRKAGNERWVALDALRGIAAVWVAWYHFYRFSPLPDVLRLSKWPRWFLLHGYLGIEIFFVLSGVVISLSIMDERISAPYALSFAVRRSIRLDPPYWITLALACVIRTAVGTPPPPSSVVAHIFYLQNVLGIPNIVPQFWTLCYEIQFYLVLILLVGCAQKGGKFVGWLAAVAPLAASLVLVTLGRTDPGWFLNYWYAFALGVGTTAVIRKRISPATWAIFTGLVLLLGFVLGRVEVICVAVTSFVIGFAGLAGKLGRWSGGPVFQYLGRISYSLYLLHFVGTAFARIAAVRADSVWEGFLVFVIATLIAIGCAELLYRFVESPAHKLSRRLGPPVASYLLRSMQPAARG